MLEFLTLFLRVPRFGRCVFFFFRLLCRGAERVDGGGGRGFAALMGRENEIISLFSSPY